MNGKVLVVALATLCSTGLGTQAMADTFVENVRFGPGPNDFADGTGTTAGPGGTMLYYFDTNGGSLTSITINYGYNISSNITVTNTGSGPANGTVDTKSGARFGSYQLAIAAALNRYVNNYVDPIDGTTVGFGDSTLTPIAADVRGTQRNYDLASGSSANYVSDGWFSRGPYIVTDASFLAAFSQAGGGTFTPLFTTLTGLESTSYQGSANASKVAFGSGYLTLTFNYDTSIPQPTSVPEPATAVLLGAGLLGIGLTRRGARERGAA